MKYAIISDIHSNVQALNAALDCIDKDNVDEIICLGDIVGYNANPCECVEIIRQHPKIKHVIQGNHDDAITRFNSIGMSEWREWSKDACDGLEYSHRIISEKDIEWIKFCQKNQKIINDPKTPFLISHYSPCGYDSEYGYILDHHSAYNAIMYIQANQIIKDSKIKLTFYGHSHLPTFVYGTKRKSHFDMGAHIADIVYKIDISNYYLINCGAIGQPRNNGITSFGIFDSSERTVIIKRFCYDYKMAQNAILMAGYSKTIADRLISKFS